MKRITENTKQKVDDFDQKLTVVSSDGPKQNTQLTAYSDVETNTESTPTVDAVKAYPIGNPFPDTTPTKLLERQFLVQTYHYTATSLALNLPFPGLLLSIDSIAAHLETFAYLRAGVEIRIKINSTPYHAGLLQFSHIPCHTGTRNTITPLVRSGNSPVYIEVSSQEAVTIKCPYISPQMWIDLSNNVGPEICDMWLDPITPLRRANTCTKDEVIVQIYASFTNPESTGNIDIADSHKRFARRQRRAFKAQSGKEIANKSENQTNIEPAKAATGLGAILDPIMKTIPIVGEVATALGPIIGGFLDKPTSDKIATPISMQFTSDICLGKGLDLSNKLSLLPDAGIKNRTAHTGYVDSNSSLQKIVGTPMISSIATFDDTFTHWDEHATPYITQNNPAIAGDFLNFTAKHFEYWRGSIKYLFYFICPKFYSARFRIMYNFHAPTADALESGDIVSQVIDVKGPTIHKITVPFLWKEMWRQTVDGLTWPTIRIERIGIINGCSAGEEAIIDLVVFRAGGEDMRFLQMRPRHVPLAPGRKTFQAQCDMRAEFQKVFPPIIEGSSFTIEEGSASCENVSTLEQCIKRYAFTTRFTTEYNDTYPDPLLRDPFHSFGAMFHYWSGSRRAKLYMTASTNGTVVSDFVGVRNQADTGTIAQSIGQGAHITSTTKWPWLNFEIPYYAGVPMYPLDTSAIPFTVLTPPKNYDQFSGAFTNNGFTLYLSGGDDFLYSVLVGPQDFDDESYEQGRHKTSEKTHLVKTKDDGRTKSSGKESDKIIAGGDCAASSSE